MAYKFAMRAVEACERRFAFDDALGWLDFAAGVALTSAESDAVNRATAQLLEVSDRRERPPARMSASGAAEGHARTATIHLPQRALDEIA